MIRSIKKITDNFTSKFEIQFEGEYGGLKYYIKAFEKIDNDGFIEDYWINGYARIPENHKLYGRNYFLDLENILNTNNIELSYAGVDPQTESTDWSIGFTAKTINIEHVKYDCQDLINSLNSLT